MGNYDTFAPFYDLAMGDRADVARELKKIFRKHHPKAKTLLELGCGTGSLIKQLCRSFTCRGIDRSSGMIEEACKKIPNAEFSVADITNFRFPGRFDIVLCAFDTINHVTSFADWRKVFVNAARQLDDAGIFVFDINTEKKLNRYFEEPPFAERRADSTAVFEVFKKPRGRFDIEIQVFKRKTGHTFVMKEMVVHEATFPVPKIIKELGRYFKRVHVLDLERTLPTSESEELYFICSHPRRQGKKR